MTDTVMQRMLAVMPRYANRGQEGDRSAKLRQLLMNTRFPEPEQEALAIVERYLAGEEFDPIEAVTEAYRAAQDSQAVHLLSTVLRERTVLNAASRRENRTADPDEVAAALTVLRSELASLIETVRGYDRKLGSARTIEQAVKRKKADAWLGLTEAVEHYSEIRAAQRTLTLRAQRLEVVTEHGGVAEAFDSTAYLRDFFTHEPYWIARRSMAYGSNGVNVAHTNWRQRALTAEERQHLEWLRPDDSDGGGFSKPNPDVWAEGQPEAYLRWLATETQPWVPSIDEIETAVNTAQSNLFHVGTHHNAGRGPQARKALAAAIGIPLPPLPDQDAEADAVSDED